jgi:hypothetical protein
LSFTATGSISAISMPCMLAPPSQQLCPRPTVTDARVLVPGRPAQRNRDQQHAADQAGEPAGQQAGRDPWQCGQRGGHVDLEWARLPGPQKVLAATRQRLQAGHGLDGSPLRIDLTPSEREEVGRLLGISWVRSGRAVGAQALTRAIGDFCVDVTYLLAATGEQVRDIRAEREPPERKLQQNAKAPHWP